MGTCNFHTVNANDIYVLFDSFEEDGVRYENEWSFIKEAILDYGLAVGWMDALCKSFKHGREVDTAIICQEYWFEYKNSGLKYLITAYITINPGYYEHSNLDYRFTIDFEESDTPKEELLERLVEDWQQPLNTSYISYVSGGVANKVWNEGLRKMQAKNFKKEAERFIEYIINECEEMVKSQCHEIFRKIGTFSNGEGVYEKVD